MYSFLPYKRQFFNRIAVLHREKLSPQSVHIDLSNLVHTKKVLAHLWYGLLLALYFERRTTEKKTK